MIISICELKEIIVQKTLITNLDLPPESDTPPVFASVLMGPPSCHSFPYCYFFFFLSFTWKSHFGLFICYLQSIPGLWPQSRLLLSLWDALLWFFFFPVYLPHSSSSAKVWNMNFIIPCFKYWCCFAPCPRPKDLDPAHFPVSGAIICPLIPYHMPALVLPVPLIPCSVLEHPL